MFVVSMLLQSFFCIMFGVSMVIRFVFFIVLVGVFMVKLLVCVLILVGLFGCRFIIMLKLDLCRFSVWVWFWLLQLMMVILVWGRLLVFMGEVFCGGKKKEWLVVEVMCWLVRGKWWRGCCVLYRYSYYEVWWWFGFGFCIECWLWWLCLKLGFEMKKFVLGWVWVFDEFWCVCCLYVGLFCICWLGNKYEYKN